MASGMTEYDLQEPSTDAEETIRALQAELAETNRGLIALSWELEARVDERTTQLRAAHDELQRTNAELMQLTLDLEDRVAQRTESEEKFRNLAETATDAILSADSYGKIIYFNPAAERIFSYSSTEIMGQPLTLLMPERFHDPHRQGFDRFLRTGEARVIGKTVELAARKKNGAEFPIELALSSWKTREGTFFTAILSDITERKRAEESLEQHRSELAESNAELAAANKELETFSYSVSHDLRAPLRSIDGFIQALLEDYAEKFDDNGKNHLLRVRAATRHMGELIDDLLNLSRVTRTEMHREKIDLSAMARSITAELERTQPGRQVKFVIEGGLGTMADPHLLRIVLENLLGNAWKFTSKRASACIEFAKTRRDGATAYFVRDDGAGFDPAHAKRLFGAFQRLHATSEFPGTGVGLATVQRIVHRHGGRVWAEGAVERGATFYFTLPETNL
jgi:PAS domain S-box-containing protein